MNTIQGAMTQIIRSKKNHTHGEKNGNLDVPHGAINFARNFFPNSNVSCTRPAITERECPPNGKVHFNLNYCNFAVNDAKENSIYVFWYVVYAKATVSFFFHIYSHFFQFLHFIPELLHFNLFSFFLLQANE